MFPRSPWRWLLLVAALATPLRAAEWLTVHYPFYQRPILAPDQIDYSRFSHLIYFQILPKPNGDLDASGLEETPTGNSANPGGLSDRAYLASRVHEAGGKFLVCVGGDGTYSNFAAAIGSGTRANFVAKLVQWVSDNNFDGLDIDMEPMRPEDDENFYQFAKALRQSLPAGKLLTADIIPDDATAAIVTKVNAADAVQPKNKATDYFDQVNLMTYDMSGPYPGWNTWHDSPVLTPADRKNADGSDYPSADQSVGFFTSRGVAAAKIGIGASSNGKRWRPARALGQNARGMAISEVTYRDAITKFFTFANYRYDSGAQAAYLVASGNFISFPDAKASADKARYVHAQGLGGLMVWDISAQFTNGQFPLLTAMQNALQGSASQAGISVSLSPAGALTSGQSTVDAGASALQQPKVISLLIHNGSSTTLTGLGASFTGGRAGDYALASELPASLSSGAEVEVRVQFRPTVAGLSTTLFHVTSSDPATPSFDLGLRGLGLSPANAAGTYLGYSDSLKTLLRLTVTARGAFTGSIVQNGSVKPVSGMLSATGNVTGTFGAPALAASLQLFSSGSSLHPSGFSLSGSLGDDATFTAWHTAAAAGVPLASTGRYTLALEPAGANTATAPPGYGYASAVVAPNGLATVSGALADGTPLLFSTPVVGGGTDGNNQLIVNLVPVSKAYSLIGAIDLAKAKTSLGSSGTLAWRKAPSAALAYGDGFQTELNVIGHLWAPPAVGTRALALGDGDANGNARITLSGGGIDPSVVEALRLPLTSRLSPPVTSFQRTNANSASLLSAGLDIRTGLITGTFRDAGSGVTLRFGAASIQAPIPYALGFFVGPVTGGERTSGPVSLEKSP